MPVSVLASINQILERLMYDQLTRYFNDIISKNLCAFRKGYGCQDDLIGFIGDLKRALDRALDKKGCILIDSSKAFTCLPHLLSTGKLTAYGLLTRPALQS